MMLVSGVEGKAGMVAIVDVNHTIDLQELYKDLKKALPSYAVPVFIRLLEKVDTTGGWTGEYHISSEWENVLPSEIK